jgi:hypothetical protein
LGGFDVRKALLAAILGSVVIAAALFYAEQHRVRLRAGLDASTVDEVLAAQNRAQAAGLEELFQQADRDAADILRRWSKRPAQKSFAVDTQLNEPRTPRWLVSPERRLRAAGTPDQALLEDALEAHLAGRDRLAHYASNGKHFIFIKGTASGQPYAAAYTPEAFFAPVRAPEGMRVWLLDREGVVLYHPLPRFIGSKAANLRPVAASIEALAAGRKASFTQKYLGLEGKDAIGAWISLPAEGLILASEWPKGLRSGTASSALLSLAAFSGGLGLLLLGFFVGSRSSQAVRPTPIFDTSRLDDEALAYLESVKRSADEAIQFAREKENAAEGARVARAELNAQISGLRWQLDSLEEFQERILPGVTGKQVWTELARMVAERSPGLTLVVYRYSATTFSLVPETVFSALDLPAASLSYLKDSRIFIGNLSYLGSLLQTQAFARWNKSRERHMPDLNADFRAFPFSGPAGTQGAILAVFDRRMNQDRELEEALDLLARLMRRTASFCDSLGRLLQSLYAKGSAWQAVASASNDARNQSRPS